MIQVDVQIMGDAKAALQMLIPRVRKLPTEKWLARLTGYKKKFPLGYKKQGGLRMQQVIDEVYQMTERQGHRHDRRGSAPDVGRTVLQNRRELEMDQLRRRGNDGIRLPGRGWRPICLPGRHRGRDCW